ncbi:MULTISPECIES: GNAT family N-acetyltransferase [Kitasatospora]|uniref:Putative acetyltransferase n=1 Tax=Kitasatospora setae (strain ATCC 33774 / DSM 43861 / JCM 3304 / KCC A-0304 / NBRC 14216 / KM-6054) TaxID=452652 RepID=E4N891_KITSK|nr:MULTISPECIES: GNAT family N-acetyltransferase [Kitasatospora]BAJ27422.1 putative acetyltransferase [Kitasatospora setae KM-6054]
MPPSRPHPPRLRTARLVLRRLTPADLPAVTALCGDPEVMRYLDDGRPVPPARVADELLPGLLREYAELPDGLGCWAVEAAGRFLGWAALRPPSSVGLVERPDPADLELGYRLLPATRGRGYATEAAAGLVRAAFAERAAGRVVATTMAVNAPSRRVLERAGLRHVRSFLVDWPDPIPGSEHGDVVYALTRAEWAAEPSTPVR